MSQEWVNLGSMSAVSQSNGHPHPPLSPFLLHFRGHFFHFDLVVEREIYKISKCMAGIENPPPFADAQNSYTPLCSL